LATGVAISLVAPAQAVAKKRRDKPNQIVPQKKKARDRRPPKDADLSEGGQRRGVMELTLGGVTGGVSLLLIGRGIWEVFEARRLARECDTSDEIACSLANPPLHPRIAAGLSFAFAVPIGVASGLLFARGARIHRDYEKFHRAHRVSIRPWTTGEAGGLVVGGRF
jgi:hypothetical protein